VRRYRPACHPRLGLVKKALSGIQGSDDL